MWCRCWKTERFIHACSVLTFAGLVLELIVFVWQQLIFGMNSRSSATPSSASRHHSSNPFRSASRDNAPPFDDCFASMAAPGRDLNFNTSENAASPQQQWQGRPPVDAEAAVGGEVDDFRVASYSSSETASECPSARGEPARIERDDDDEADDEPRHGGGPMGSPSSKTPLRPSSSAVLTSPSPIAMSPGAAAMQQHALLVGSAVKPRRGVMPANSPMLATPLPHRQPGSSPSASVPLSTASPGHQRDGVHFAATAPTTDDPEQFAREHAHRRSVDHKRDRRRRDVMLRLLSALAHEVEAGEFDDGATDDDGRGTASSAAWSTAATGAASNDLRFPNDDLYRGVRKDNFLVDTAPDPWNLMSGDFTYYTPTPAPMMIVPSILERRLGLASASSTLSYTHSPWSTHGF
jgi:hypothetical protein